MPLLFFKITERPWCLQSKQYRTEYVIFERRFTDLILLCHFFHFPSLNLGGFWGLWNPTFYIMRPTDTKVLLKEPPRGFSYLSGSSTKSGKLTSLFTLFWVWTSHQRVRMCLSLNTFRELICTGKKCLLPSSLIISDCLLDLDVTFCWLGYLHWIAGCQYCRESMGYSQNYLHQMFC